MNTQKNKCVAVQNKVLVKKLLGDFNRFETFKVVFCKMDSEYYGKSQPQFNRILINNLKPKRMQIYTLIHERVHEILDKSLGFGIIGAKINGLHDLIDYFVSDFRFTYRSFIASRGYKAMIKEVLNQYVKNWQVKYKVKFYLIALLKRKGYTEIEIAETLKEVVN
jgi:hypothetical protein